MAKINKIQISPVRIMPDIPTVWNKPGDDVDMVMDIHNLTFREGTMDEIYSFHVIEHLFSEEITPAIKNWKDCLKKDGTLFITTNDFEFIARAFIGGDLPLQMVNQKFATPTHITRESFIDHIADAGFIEGNIVMWNLDVPDKFKKEDYELVMSAKKHGK